MNDVYKNYVGYNIHVHVSLYYFHVAKMSLCLVFVAALEFKPAFS